MKKSPKVWRLPTLLREVSKVSACVDGEYVPSRPVGFHSFGNRIRCAWLVFVGSADAVIWPEDEWEEAESHANAALANVGGAS